MPLIGSQFSLAMQVSALHQIVLPCGVQVCIFYTNAKMIATVP